jgi:hypothetical protein
VVPVGDPADVKFDSDFGVKNPGDQTSETASSLQELQVGPEIGTGTPPAGGSMTVKFEFFATATNYVGGKAQLRSQRSPTTNSEHARLLSTHFAA